MNATQAATWASVQRTGTANRCKCALRPAMTRLELDALGGGCTMPSYCCPTLDGYRRQTRHLPDE